MAPSGQEGRVLEFFLFPLKQVRFSSFYEWGEVHGENVTETAIFAVTSGEDKKLVTDFNRRVEPSGAGFRLVLRSFDFCPAESFEIEDPEVVHVCNAFAPENDQKREDEFCNVVGSFPGRGLVLLGSDLDPVFGCPVEDADRIETLLVGTSSSENHDLVIF